MPNITQSARTKSATILQKSAADFVRVCTSRTSQKFVRGIVANFVRGKIIQILNTNPAHVQTNKVLGTCFVRAWLAWCFVGTHTEHSVLNPANHALVGKVSEKFVRLYVGDTDIRGRHHHVSRRFPIANRTTGDLEMQATDPLTPTETIRAKVARAAWTCGEATLTRVAAEMGLTPRPESPDPGRPSRRNLPDLDTILADADEEFS